MLINYKIKKNMQIKFKYFFMLILFIASISYGQKTNNNIIVFDITGSMVGLPAGSGSTNIWDQSINLLEKQVKSFPPNEKVTLYLFGEKLIKVGEYSTNDANTVLRVKAEVERIRTNGSFENYTCIYRSLNDIISNIDTKEINTIYLFTDGKNSDNHAPCGNYRSLNDIATRWQDGTEINEYLYIFKLKSFVFDQISNSNTRTQIIENALTNLNVVIEPINTKIRINKKNRLSSQQYRITGAGVDYLPTELKIKVGSFILKNLSRSESAYSRPNELLVNSSVQQFEINTHNQLDVIESGIYKGKVSYSFVDGSSTKRLSAGDYTITVNIKDIDTEVIFNNLGPAKVTIEYNDKN